MFAEINKEGLIFLNGLNQYEWVEKSVYIFADAPIFFLPFFLVLYWLYYNYKKDTSGKEKLLFIFYTTVIALSINLVVQQFISLERPEEALKGVGKLLLSHIPDASFPSDHATVSFAFLIALFVHGFKRIGFLFLPFVILMNVSRIIAGVHWPFDIIGGIVTASIANIIIVKYFIEQKLVKKLNDFIIKVLSIIKL